MGHQEKRKKVILLIILTLQNISTTELNKILQRHIRTDEAEQKLWLRMLRQMEEEEQFELALLVGQLECDFLDALLEVDMEKSVLMNQNYSENYDMEFTNSNFITIAMFMPEMALDEFMAIMAEKLDWRRGNRLIVINGKPRKDVDLKDIGELFRLCISYKMLNVAMILTDFVANRLIYTFRVYPEFELEWRVFKGGNVVPLFPSKVSNVHGYILRTIPDQVMPRSVVYTDAQGQLQVTGYIAQFIRMFAKYINSTLKFPDDMVPGNTLFYRDFVNWTQMELLDIPCSITPMMNDGSSRLMSYPYEVLNWCLMIPVEQPLSYQDFLKGFLTLATIFGMFIMDVIFTTLLTLSMRLISFKSNQPYQLDLVNVLVNPQVILAHLGSSFQLHAHPAISLRIIYVSLFVSGLLYTTAFSVQLNAFLTRPTTQAISSLDDMLRHKVKILASENEYSILLKLSGQYFLPYLSLFKIIDSYKDFSDIRSSFNSSYAYPVTSSVWYVYEAQQKLFTEQLFRRTNICFTSLDVMAFVLPRNSLHKPKFDTLITRVRDMGLVPYWLKNNFYDLVRVGQMSFEDLSQSPDLAVSYIKMEDFYYVVVSLFRAFSFSLSVFVMEILWFYRHSILNVICCKKEIK